MDNEDLLKEVGMTKKRNDEITRILIKNSLENNLNFCESIAEALGIKTKELTIEDMKETIRKVFWEESTDDDNFTELEPEEIVAFTSLELFEEGFRNFFIDATLEDELKNIRVTPDEFLKWSYILINECLKEIGLL